MRRLYSLLLAISLPIVFCRLYFKGRKNPAYRERWKERLGFVDPILNKQQKIIWIHAVSVGEVEASVPLVKKLFLHYPDLKIVMTTTTPTGAETVKRRFQTEYQDQLTHYFIPYDLISFQRRFLNRIKADLLIIMETEAWPNLIHFCTSISMPVVLANARMSKRSCRGYKRIGWLSEPMFAQLHIAAQTDQDAKRFLQIGALKSQLQVTGSLKFDQQIAKNLTVRAKALREEIGLERPVWIAASTHPGEEQKMFDAHKTILKKLPNCLLILVPRHPERFDEVHQLCLRESLETTRRSLHEKSTGAVYLADTMGELMLCYGAADVAFIAGSLEPIGGHNLLEPASLGLPILMGPHTFKIERIFQTFLKADAALCVKDSDSLSAEVLRFLTDKNHAKLYADNALAIVKKNQGASEKHFVMIDQLFS